MTLSVADAIDNLRNELSKARNAGAKSDLKFEIEEIELELQLVATDALQGSANAEISGSIWSVFTGKVGAEASGSSESEKTHRVKMKLSLAPNPDGSTKQISGHGRQPGAGTKPGT